MARPNDAVRAGAAGLALLAVGALVVHAVKPKPDADHKHSVVEWDGGRPAGARCMRATVLANKAAIDAFELDSDGGDDYAFVRICAVPDDGGVVRDLPSGIEVVEGSQEDDPGDAGAPIEVWKKGKAGGFGCACAMNATCQWKDGGSAWAYRGYTMDPGTWQGAGCLPKTCIVLQGRDVWPDECPQ